MDDNAFAGDLSQNLPVPVIVSTITDALDDVGVDEAIWLFVAVVVAGDARHCADGRDVHGGEEEQGRSHEEEVVVEARHDFLRR